jgi:DNA modification methylase
MRKEIIGNCTLYQGDCLEIMPELKMVHAVITDPPYNFSTAPSGAKHEPFSEAINTSYWFKEVLLKELDILPVRGGTIWQFLNWKTFIAVQKAAFDSDLKIESLLVWDKNSLGTGGVRGLRPSYELCALFLTGKAFIKNRSLPDIWKYPYTYLKKFHPAEKPLPLIRKIVYETEADIILDPFMGSATTGVACVNLNRRFIGIEINEKYFDTACKRIESAVSQGELWKISEE